MVEIIENAVQLVVLTCCAGFACWLSLKKQNRECARLAMFYGSYVLGDLYWLLYLVCYGHTPGIFYVPYMSWYAAYVFLDLLLLCLATAEERKFISWPSLSFLFSRPSCACTTCSSAIMPETLSPRCS